MDGADALKLTHPGAILLAWRNPVTGETRAGGCIHTDLIEEHELQAVLAVVAAQVGRMTNRSRVYREGMGFWDVDEKEFITREVAIARRIEKPNKAAAHIEVVVVRPGGSE
jgi:hypothetical protein